MRILLVEDYPRLAQSIIEGLAGFGLHVDLFATGGEGLAATKSMSYDAMILDLGLPDRDGFDVISELRAEGKRIPILILTARDGIDDRVEGLDRGADDYLLKPFAMNTDGGWLGIPFLLAMLGVAAFTIKRTLSPLEQLSALAARINPGSSEVRLPHAGIPREFLPLVRSMNSALDRLDEGLRQQCEFSANAAHQLRTPLAVLSANIDMMGDKVGAAKLRYDVELMSRIVTQLLLVARLEILNVHLDEQVNLCLAAGEAAENPGSVAISMCKTLEVDQPTEPVFVRGNRSVIVAAVRNLIENALNHSPTGGAVRIRVTELAPDF